MRTRLRMRLRRLLAVLLPRRLQLVGPRLQLRLPRRDATFQITMKFRIGIVVDLNFI